MISLVAITDADAPPPTEPLRAVRSGSLCALCVPAGDGASVTLDALVAREELIERLMEDGDLLPVRFGAELPDERAVEEVLAERHDELAAALERVRGAVELSLRVEPADGEARPAEDPPSGREYLQARIARSGLANGIHERLAALSRAATVRSGPELLRAAYLVDRDALPAFVAAVRDTQESRADLALLCTGPWAPFSFTDAEAAA